MIGHTTLQVGGCASVFLFWEIYAANDVDVPHGRVSAGRCHASENLHKNLGSDHRRLVVTVRLRPAGYAGHASPKKSGVAAPRVAFLGEAWSQAGSNRRPRHCERRALPTE